MQFLHRFLNQPLFFFAMELLPVLYIFWILFQVIWVFNSSIKAEYWVVSNFFCLYKQVHSYHLLSNCLSFWCFIEMEEELFYQTPSILKLMLYHVQLPSREAVPVCYPTIRSIIFKGTLSSHCLSSFISFLIYRESLK